MFCGIRCISRALGDALCTRRRLEHLPVDIIDAFLHAIDARELRFHAVCDIDNRLRDAFIRLRRLLRARRELFGRRRNLIRRIRHIPDELPQVLRHHIECMREVAELVARIHDDALRPQVAAREQLGALLEQHDRLRDAAREHLADDHDDDEADDCHDGERNLHRRELAVDEALRHRQQHDPVRAIDRRIRDDHVLAADVLRQRARTILHHLVKLLVEARDVLDVLVLQRGVFRSDHLAGRRDDRAHALALVVQLFDIVVETLKRNVLADGTSERTVFLVVRHGNRDAELARDLVNVRIGIERLALCLHVLVPCALGRDELARQVAGRIAHDMAVFATDCQAEQHLVLRRLDLIDRRHARSIIECAHVRGRIFCDARMRRDPARKILALAFDICLDFSRDACIECALRHEIPQE